MVTHRRRGFLRSGGFILAAFAICSCGDDSDPSKPASPVPLSYGALVTPRVSLDVDPLLVDAYQNLGADRFEVAHLAVSWAGIERGQVDRDWSDLDLHVNRARQKGIKLSVVVELLHGGEVEVPAWRWQEFPGWGDPDLGWGFVRFLRELQVRSKGTIAYLWLGEGADRYADEDTEDGGPLVSFLSMAGDSARRIFPGTRIGTLVNPLMVGGQGQETLVRALRDSLGLLGLWIYPAGAEGAPVDPATAIATLENAIDPWKDGPLAILEYGYPSSPDLGSSEEEQAQFASLTAQWLRSRPLRLELFCWAPLHDAGPSLAESLALRRFPLDPEASGAFAGLLSCSGLRRNDGSPKAARQRFYEERP